MPSRLRIAIDARAASHSQPGGFKAYVEGLITGLAGLDCPHQFLFYVDRPYRLPGGLPRNFEMRVVPAGPKLVGAGLREQVGLPLALARARVDVAHFPYNTSPLWSPARRVVTIHDLILLRPGALGAGALSRRLMNAYARLFLLWTARWAQAIITVSRFSAAQIAARFPGAAGQVHVVPLGINPVFRPQPPEIAARRAAEAFGLQAGFVLATGSADPRKNVAAAVRAYAALPAAVRRAHGLVIVLAQADLQPDLERLCAELGVAEQATFLAGLGLPALQILYAAAGVFLFPSLYEGFGLMPLEAMACGAPVVASNVTSIPEVTGDAAALVDPRDIAALAAAVGAVLGDAALAASLRGRGLQRAAEFSWPNAARQTLAVYEQVGGSRRN